MTILSVNTGTVINDGTGDTIYVAMGKINNNFANVGAIVNTVSNSITIGNTSANAVIGYNATDISIAEFSSNANNFIEVAIWNANTGNNASADFIVNDTLGTNPSSNNYIDVGINGNGFNQSNWTINGPSDGYIYTGNTNLSVGTLNSNTYLNFFIGGSLANNEVLRVTNTGVIVGNANSTVATVTVGNSTVNAQLSSSTFKVGSIGITNGAVVNTSTITVGNSTVNTFSNSSHFYSGNSTYFGLGNSTVESIVSPTGNTVIGSNSINVSNTTGNVQIGATSITLSNASVTVLTINSSAMTFNSNTITIGSANAAHTAALANGYSRLTNGLLMQWGTLTTVNTTAQIVTFSTATGLPFNTNCFSLTVSSNNVATVMAVYSVNATAFTIISNNATSQAGSWLAIGL